MPVFEVAFRVGDNPLPQITGAWKDGMPITFKRVGEEFTVSELNTWIGTYGSETLGPEPAGFSTLPEERQRQLRRRMRQLNLLLLPSAQNKNPAAIEALRQRRFGAQPTDPSRLANQNETIETMIDEAALFRSRIIEHGGWDTNWGFIDLKIHGVICVDIDWHILENNLQGPTNELIDPMLPRREWSRREWRVKYETLYSQTRINRLRDRNELVAVDRSTIYTPGQVFEKVTRE